MTMSATELYDILYMKFSGGGGEGGGGGGGGFLMLGKTGHVGLYYLSPVKTLDFYLVCKNYSSCPFIQ